MIDVFSKRHLSSPSTLPSAASFNAIAPTINFKLILKCSRSCRVAELRLAKATHQRVKGGLVPEAVCGVGVGVGGVTTHMTRILLRVSRRN